ncbi:MAG: archease [archaeon]
MKFKFLEHTADIKFQAFGKTLEEVFENSASAMFCSMHEGKIEKKIKKKIKVQGMDYESLLYNFLEELLVIFDSEHLFFAGVSRMKIKDKKLDAEIFFDKSEKYKIHLDVKAVTYNEMFVKKDEKKNQWNAQVVLDV